MRTLAIDIGGTGIKAILLDPAGEPLTERTRTLTPQPALPGPVLDAIVAAMRVHGDCERISIGFPGVVVEGVTKTAPNLHPSAWRDFPLAEEVSRRTGRPARALNDAGMQGLGVIERRGLEMVLTLGTGLGCGLYIDGRYVPNLELAHHPFRRGRTYEQRVSEAERKRIGDRRWSRRVMAMLDQLEPIFNYRVLYLTGGNARKLDPAGLPENVRIVDRKQGIRGGIKLWD